MSKISISDIEKVANLARIEISQDRLDSICLEFNSIIEFVDTIENADTGGVIPTSQVTGINGVSREDKVTKSQVAPEDLLALAPETQDGYIKVRKVL